MPIQLVLFAAFALQTPQEAIDRTWGQLARSPHYDGSWRVEVGGRTFTGDRVVVSSEPAYNPGAHQASTQRWIHFASSTTADYCAIAIEDPSRVYCRNATSCPEPWSCRSERLLVPAIAGIEQPTAIDVAIQTEDTKRRGRMRTALRAMTATLAEEQVLFARIHQKSLAAAVGGTVTSTPAQLVVTMPYKVALPGQTPFSGGGLAGNAGGYDQIAVSYTATIRIGPATADVAIETRELERYTERCTYADFHGGCYPPPPSCVRR